MLLKYTNDRDCDIVNLICQVIFKDIEKNDKIADEYLEYVKIYYEIEDRKEE